MTTLTAAELSRLTTWKWMYTLETAGFTPAEARRLILLRYVYAREAGVSD